MSDLYAPNQQVVRADRSGPAEEGSGGSGGAPGEPEPRSLDAMTKDELLAYAAEQGVTADASMTKAEIRAAIDAGPAPTTEASS
jgi:hypothetical protein